MTFPKVAHRNVNIDGLDSNPTQYLRWHEYFRKHQPPTLIVWGKNDTIFPPAGAEPYQRDLKTVEFHLLDTGHFALEEENDQITIWSANANQPLKNRVTP